MSENLIACNRRKRDARFTRAAIFMVVAFVLCHGPRVVPNMAELIMTVDDFTNSTVSRSLYHYPVSPREGL